MNSKALIICALLFASLPTVQAVDPISFREIAMLLRNGEDQQFIINDTVRRKLLRPPSPEEEQTLLALHATPALMTLLRDPAALASQDAAAAYAARMLAQNLQAFNDDQLARTQPPQNGPSPAKTPGGAGPANGASNAYVGKQITLKFHAADGSPVDLAELHGKVVLVDFWATWCGPCMREVPNVVAAYQKYHDKGFEIVGISLDKSKDAMLSVAAQKGMTWPQYFDGKGWENEVSTAFHVRQIPTMWLVGKNGRVATTEARENLDAEISKLLGE